MDSSENTPKVNLRNPIVEISENKIHKLLQEKFLETSLDSSLVEFLKNKYSKLIPEEIPYYISGPGFPKKKMWKSLDQFLEEFQKEHLRKSMLPLWNICLRRERIERFFSTNLCRNFDYLREFLSTVNSP